MNAKLIVGMSAVKMGACQPRQKQTIKHSATEHAKSCFLMKPPPARAPKINQFGHHRDHTTLRVSRDLSVMGVTLSCNVSDASRWTGRRTLDCTTIVPRHFVSFGFDSLLCFSSRGENYFGIFMMEMNNSNMISQRHTNSSSVWIIAHTQILNIIYFWLILGARAHGGFQ